MKLYHLRNGTLSLQDHYLSQLFYIIIITGIKYAITFLIF